LYQVAICRALRDKDVTVSVGDMSEDYEDIEHVRDIGAIIEACEATDSPVVQFFWQGNGMGSMVVMVGYGEESIADHQCTDFMDRICYSS